jgi:hypothetical protein
MQGKRECQSIPLAVISSLKHHRDRAPSHHAIFPPAKPAMTSGQHHVGRQCMIHGSIATETVLWAARWTIEVQLVPNMPFSSHQKKTLRRWCNSAIMQE